MNPVYSKSKITVSVGLHTQRKGGMMLSSDIELSNSQILADQLRYVLLFKGDWTDRKFGVWCERDRITQRKAYLTANVDMKT